jgi:hypothetical protein
MSIVAILAFYTTKYHIAAFREEREVGIKTILGVELNGG